MNGRRPRLGFAMALGANGLSFSSFWVLVWTSNGHWIGTVVALQVTLLLVTLGGIFAGAPRQRHAPR